MGFDQKAELTKKFEGVFSLLLTRFTRTEASIGRLMNATWSGSCPSGPKACLPYAAAAK